MCQKRQATYLGTYVYNEGGSDQTPSMYSVGLRPEAMERKCSTTTSKNTHEKGPFDLVVDLD